MLKYYCALKNILYNYTKALLYNNYTLICDERPVQVIVTRSKLTQNTNGKHYTVVTKTKGRALLTVKVLGTST